MKKVLYTILAVAISLSACRKSQNTLSVTGNQNAQITEADADDSRATAAGRSFKKSDNGLEMDYNLVIKEVSKNKYTAIVKFKGLTLNGKDVKGSKDGKLQSVVLTFNNLKVDPKSGKVVLVDEKNSSETQKWQPLSVTGEVNQKSEDDPVIITPLDNDFDIEEDLLYSVLNVTLAVTIDNAIHVSSSGDQTNILYQSLLITVPRVTNYQISVPNVAKSGDPIYINKVNTNTAVGISVTEKGIITFTDEQEYFVLGSGHTVVQEPELSKAKVEGKDGYVTLVFTGDPAQETKTVTYQPEAVSANNPKDPKEMITFPVMKFTLTHFNQKNGVLRFKSTQKWSDLYKTAPDKTKGNVVRQNMMIPVLFRI